MLEEIAKWVPGEGPAALEPLSDGLVNRTYRVTRGGRHFSLRLAAADTQGLGLDRRWECRIRQEAEAAGLATAVRHCDPVAGILVADWMDGHRWTAQEVRMPENLEVMAQLLHRVHSLAIPQPARIMSPADWVACYSPPAGSGRAHSADDAGLRSAARTRLRALGPPAVHALCHSDVHRLNVLIADSPLLLDWEYAHVSEPLWDLAGWSSNNDWPADTTERFLACYLGGVTAADSARLGRLCWLYDYVCLLWSERYVLERPGPSSDSVRERAAVLRERLAATSGSRAT